jgi:hypothetical protein
MPKSRNSSSRSSSSPRSPKTKAKTKKSRAVKGVAMPAAHIKRIVDGEKKMYATLNMPYENEDFVRQLLQKLRFKRPENPYSFWGNIYVWHDAVKHSLNKNELGM